jgi:predicted aspartyl protease
MAQIDGTIQPGGAAILTVQIAVDPDFEDWLRHTGQTVPPPVSVLALIDTGADNTLISPTVVTQLGLSSASKVPIVGISGQQSIRTQYDVRLILPHGVEYEIPAIEVPLAGLPFECLIGCNVLARGTFFYDGPHGKFRLTF